VNLGILFETEYPRILGYVRRKLGRYREHADDVTQEVFEKYLNQIKRHPVPHDSSAWLMRVARNSSVQFFRDKKKDRHLISECDFAGVFKNSRVKIKSLDELPQPAPPPFVDPLSQQYEPWIDHLDTLKEFKEDARAAIVLRYPDILGRRLEAWVMHLFKPRMANRILKANTQWPGGASVKDIAQLLGMPQGTVTSHLSRVKAKLKPLFMERILAEKAKRGSAIKYSREFRVRPFAPILGRKPAFTDGSDHARKFVELMPLRERPEARSTQSTLVTGAPDRTPQHRSEPERRSDSYRCGSAFKGCQHCGSVRYSGKCKCGNTVQRRENSSVRCERPGLNDPGQSCGREIKLTRKIYDSGFDVWRSYSPQTTGWTYWCGTCGAKDETCWENCAAELGLEPRLQPSGSRTPRKKPIKRHALG